MSNKKHFYHGCPWSGGPATQGDTDQRYNWDEVDCGHCLHYMNRRRESDYWYYGPVGYEWYKKNYYDTVEFLKNEDS